MRILPLIAALLFTSASAQFATSTTTPERTLLERVLTSDWSANPDTLSIKTGQLPADFPFALPAGSKVIGSVVLQRPGDNDGPSTSVYWDSPQSPLATQQALTRTLEQDGWKPLPLPIGPGGQEGGFQPSDSSSGAMWYRRNPDQTVLFRVKTVGGVTQGGLYLNRPRSLDQQLRMATSMGGRPTSLLPVLTPPGGAVVMPQGSGMSGDDAQQSARIETELSADKLFDHYSSQLKKQGWAVINQAKVGGIQTSIWSFKKGQTQGLGSLSLKTVSKGRYQASISTFLGR